MRNKNEHHKKLESKNHREHLQPAKIMSYKMDIEMFVTTIWIILCSVYLKAFVFLLKGLKHSKEMESPTSKKLANKKVVNYLTTKGDT